MLVTEHADGCRPRYVCVRYQRRTSGLLHLKLSQSRTWPLMDAVDQPVDCRAFSYDDDAAASPLRARRFRLLYAPCTGPRVRVRVRVQVWDRVRVLVYAGSESGPNLA